jgi:hypothetical protein
MISSKKKLIKRCGLRFDISPRATTVSTMSNFRRSTPFFSFHHTAILVAMMGSSVRWIFSEKNDHVGDGSPSHYRNQPLCRVSRALGKAINTLGKGFAECHTRQRAHGKKAVGKAAFAECLLSGTRQRLCRVPDTRQRPNRKILKKNRKKNFKIFF